jgi:hypothetical protein
VATVPLPAASPPGQRSSPPFHRPGRIYEEKVDGGRIIAYTRGIDVQLIGRTGEDHTKRFVWRGAVAYASDREGRRCRIFEIQSAICEPGETDPLPPVRGQLTSSYDVPIMVT